ncbi:M1 family metallopeptidase [Micromonospora sp. NPDC049559]|uniref:M1 family metallopeptidase n=1 Tax=Micromonospora sp. NPDC049559 TaxID=3155923 RepID=UPI0034400E66
MRRFGTAVAAGLAVALAGATPGMATGGGYRPGSPGVGDSYYPTYGNGGYDVLHYDLDVRYQPSSDELTGRAVIRARATQNLSSFNLDLVGLTVDAVTVDGRRAAWSRTDHELTVVSRLADRKSFTVEVRYHGVPETAMLPGTTLETGFMHTDDGAVVAGQPEVAAFWYPVNDHPRDKATYTFAVTVPQGLTAICNGVPLGHSTRGGWTTWRWAELTPMISYLATATVGEFRLTQSLHHGRPMVLAVDSALPPGLADDALGRTGEITDFLVGQFGPYPFEANGGIVDAYDNLAFALENQTRTVYSKYFFDEETTTGETYVVAHELAHQWYGDSVGLHSWQDIWLNEGFASYAEWLWSEHLGEGTPQEIFDFYYAQPDSAGYWAPAPGDPGVDGLFDDSVYTRGAMTLQALRMTVGDADFWRIARGWYARNRNGNGSTAEFIAYAERVSHRQLDALFDAWLFTATRPAYPGGGAPTTARTAAPQLVPNAVASLQRRLDAGWRS